jgi:hypothetical protein
MSHPGEILLSGIASLDNRRPVPGKPYSFIYDATFTCADAADGIGSFRCFVGSNASKKQDDLYDLQTKVLLLFHSHNVTHDYDNRLSASDQDAISTASASETKTSTFSEMFAQ